jgi:hypothetical protein
MTIALFELEFYSGFHGETADVNRNGRGKRQAMKISWIFMVMSALVLGGWQSAVHADDDDDRHKKHEKWLKDQHKHAEKQRERAEKDREKRYKHHGRLSEDQREWLEDERERREEWLEDRRERYEDWLEDERERREERWEDHGRRRGHWRLNTITAPLIVRRSIARRGRITSHPPTTIATDIGPAGFGSVGKVA